MSTEALPTLYQEQIHMTKYSRWQEDSGRREYWSETVTRYMDFMDGQTQKFGYKLTEKEYNELHAGIHDLESLGSMRSMMTAGKALERDNVAGYNCAYLAVNRVHAFDEAMYILMCGTGVGFSVERQHVKQLPEVPDELFESDHVISVPDSKLGWAKSYRLLLGMLYSGEIPKVDLTKLRGAGEPLKTFGGRSSGPEPLDRLIRYTINVFRNARGRRLTSLECHGIMCKIGEIVVVGGVRRSALISLSNLSDDRMRDCKSGDWHVQNPEYRLANNSVAYTEKPEMARFMDEWMALMKSGSGERGIFNRQGIQKIVERNGRRDPNHEFGTNPCSEIILRDREFCNLTEVVARAGDTLDTLKEKVRRAVILGTIQSTLTDFRYLSKKWKQNCEEERLLGVSITGIMDNALLNGRGVARSSLEYALEELKAYAVEVNKEWAEKLGINPAAAITCVKPSGTVSQLVDSASGIHPRYSRYYIRTNRASKNDPVAQFMRDSGVPCEDDLMDPENGWVLSFPVKAPEEAIVRDDMSALDQLDLWLVYARHWCEHKPSITVYVREDEWLEVGAFVYKHFDEMSGVSFMPHSDHIYQQAPYTEVSKEVYMEAVEAMPEKLYWDVLKTYETHDQTEGMQELACVAGSCELT